MPLSVVKMERKKESNLRWPVDRLLEELDEYEELVIVARKKDGGSYKMFSTGLRNIFWWLGVLEVLKQDLINESVTVAKER